MCLKDGDTLIDILAAVIIDFIIGDPSWFPHPVIYIGKLISCLEKSGRKLCKKESNLKLWGGLIVLVTGFISFIIPFIILRLLSNYKILYHIINILLLWTVIAAKCLHKEAIKVYEELKEGNLEGARIKLSYIVGRDTNELNAYEIIRADVETVAENTSDGVIAPLIFAMVGGVPLAMLYKAINTMDSMLGYMNEKYKYIGFFPAKVDDVFNYIPSRITGILIALSAPIVDGNIVHSLKIMWRDRKNHKSPNCAYPEGAAAGAMGVQLGGTNRYFGELVYKPTIGNKNKELGYRHILDTIKLMYASEIILIIIYLIVFIIK